MSTSNLIECWYDSLLFLRNQAQISIGVVKIANIVSSKNNTALEKNTVTRVPIASMKYAGKFNKTLRCRTLRLGLSLPLILCLINLKIKVWGGYSKFCTFCKHSALRIDKLPRGHL